MTNILADKIMDATFDELAKDVKNYLSQVGDNGSPVLSDRFQHEFRHAYTSGGFASCDMLVAGINAVLRAQGSKSGMANGCAVEGEEGQAPEFLHVVFIDFTTDKVLYRDAVNLLPEGTDIRPA